MRRPRESVAEAVACGRDSYDSPAAAPRGPVGVALWTEESVKKPQDTKAARGNREPYNDDRRRKYALRLYLYHLLGILAARVDRRSGDR